MCGVFLLFRKKDLLIIACVLLLAAGFYGVVGMRAGRQALSGVVEIYAGNSLYRTVPLGSRQTIRVEQESGEVNVIVVDESGFHMESASCRNQLCIQQGMVTVENFTRRALGRSIVCLPNRVHVQLALSVGDQPIDEYAPDI